MKNIKEILNTIKGKNMEKKYMDFAKEMKKDFILIVKDIMQGDNKISKEAEELIDYYHNAVKDFAKEMYIKDYKEFLDALIEYNFVDSMDVIRENLKENQPFIYYVNETRRYTVAKNLMKEKLGLKPVGHLSDLAEIMKEIIDEIDEENITHEHFFAHRTTLVNKLDRNIRKGMDIYDEDMIEEEIKELKELKKENDELAESKLKLEIKDGDIDEAVKGNLIIPENNLGSLYTVRFTMTREEFEKNPDIFRNAYCSANVASALSDEKAYLIFNARSEGEIYIFLKLVVDEDINFEEMLIDKFIKRAPFKYMPASFGARFDKDIVKGLINNDTFPLDYTIMHYLNENFVVMDNEGGIELKLQGVQNLIDSPATIYSKKYDIEMNGQDFAAASFSLHTVADKNYRNYAIMYTYILLNMDDKKVRKFFDASMIRDDNREKTTRLLEALEELNFIHPDKVEYKDLIKDINKKVSKIVKNEDYDVLNIIMDIVDSSFILCMASAHVKATLDIIHSDKNHNKMN